MPARLVRVVPINKGLGEGGREGEIQVEEIGMEDQAWEEDRICRCLLHNILMLFPASLRLHRASHICTRYITGTYAKIPLGHAGVLFLGREKYDPLP